MDDLPILDTILADDQYERVRGDGVEVGDVVIYRGARDAHSGIVSKIVTPYNWETGADVVWVRSKWGVLGEYEHQLKDGPYGQDYSIEFWRLRQ